MTTYHVWQIMGDQANWIDSDSDLAAAQARADLYSRHGFARELPIRYVVTGPHDETIDVVTDTKGASDENLPCLP